MSFLIVYSILGMVKGQIDIIITDLVNNVIIYNYHRISYIVYALEMIKKRSEKHSKVLFLYDVACILSKHLKVQSI